jgi:hypothetical protein
VIPERYPFDQVQAITLSSSHNQMVIHMLDVPDIHIHNEKIWEISEAVQHAYFGSQKENITVF